MTKGRFDMKDRILNLLMAALIGAGGMLVVSSCTSTDLAGINSAVSGTGAACTTDKDCATGLECEHATCQPHQSGDHDAGVKGGDDQGEGDDGQGTASGDDDQGEHDGHDAGTAKACTAGTDCATGQECDDGFCKDHQEHEGDNGGDAGHDGSGDSSGSDGSDG